MLPPGVIPEAPNLTTEDEQYGHQVFAQLSDHYPLDRDDAHISRVRDVVDRLAKAIGADKEPWHVYVLKDDSVENAAATRGNFIFVWSGMLKMIRDDTDIATVLAHELSHVLAGHTQPNPADEAKEMMAGVAGRVAGEILSHQPGAIGMAGGLAEALVSETIKAFVVNPDAQRKELEADRIGLFVMAKAKYNPEDAISFWERMAANPGTAGIPLAFLSTHPQSAERVAALKEILPEAMAVYQGKVSTHSAIPVREKRKGKVMAPANENVLAPAADDFDYRPKNKVPLNEWFVIDDAAPVFSSPDAKSKQVGTLSYAEIMNVQSETDQWLKISKPMDGYVQRRTAEIMDN